MNLNRIWAGVLVLLLAGVAAAQTSTSWKVEEYSFNSGGAPSQGAVPASASFSLTLASIGDSVRPVAIGSPSFTLAAGFGSAYAPPGEVTGLLLTDKTTLVWNAESSAGLYNLYRDDTSDGYGDCEEQDLAATTATDSSTPTSGSTFHYLVTVNNRLSEEGSKGFQSDLTTERLGSFGLPVCP